jgi:two-component system KDP operon response regulator KdpE
LDDDPTFRRGLSASLKTGGFAVDEARNAEDALAFILQRPVDIVLLDINMPGTNGVAACQRVRTVAPKSGIIMLTVRDSEDDRVQALGMGADDYVTKPFRRRELLARMRACSGEPAWRKVLPHRLSRSVIWSWS